MQIIFIAFIVAISAAWLWFCITMISQNHQINWKELIFWVFLAAAVRSPFTILERGLDDVVMANVLHWGSWLLMMVILYLVLTFRFGVEKFVRKVSILVLYIIGLRLLLWPLSCG